LDIGVKNVGGRTIMFKEKWESKWNVLKSSLRVTVPKFGKITRPKKETTNALNEARTQTFDGLYQSLGTKEGEKSIYSLAKGRERKTRDFDKG
jgi:hypothetical protein